VEYPCLSFVAVLAGTAVGRLTGQQADPPQRKFQGRRSLLSDHLSCLSRKVTASKL